MTRPPSAYGLLLLGSLVAGCASGATPPPSPPASPTASPTAGPTATAGPPATDAPSPAGTPAVGGPTVTLVLDDQGPILRSTEGPPGLPYVLPAAAARDADGSVVLITEWFGGPGQQLPTLSRSDDLREWVVGREPIFTDLGLGLAAPGPVPQSVVRLDDGSWMLFGWGSTPARSSSLFTWTATATDLLGPWTIAEPLAVAAGPAGSWDEETAAVSSVLRDETGFLMWYEGEGPGSTARGDIGLASSTDGAAWRKWDDAATTDPALAASDPVLTRGICGPGTAAELVQAQVERVASGYVTIFGGRAGPQAPMAIFAATSPDGIAWTCSSAEPLLEAADIPPSLGIHTIQSLPLADGSIALILESLGDGKSDLWLATVEVAR